MSISVFRVDDRLIHGQVVEGWLNRLEIKCVVVANDSIANDSMQKILMEMVVPNDIEVFVNNLQETIEIFKNNEFLNKKTMLLVSSPKDAFKLIESGIQISSLNIGGIHFSEGKNQILEFMSVDDEDCKYLNLINQRNIEIEGRPLPDFEKVDIIKSLTNFMKAKNKS